MFTILSRRILHNLRVCNNDLHNVLKFIEYDRCQDTKKMLLIYENIEFWEPIPEFTINDRDIVISSNEFGKIEVKTRDFDSYLKFVLKKYNIVESIYDDHQDDHLDITFRNEKIETVNFDSRIINTSHVRFRIRYDIVFDELIRSLRRIKNKISKIEIFLKIKLNSPYVLYKI